MLTATRQSITVDDVLRKVHEDSQGKMDYTTTMNNLRMDPKGHVAFLKLGDVAATGPKDIDFAPSDWAYSQAFSKLGMPGQYMKKMLEVEPEMVADHFNYWTQKSSSDIMLRTRVRGNQGFLRGLVSDVYSAYDNDMAMESLGNILKMGEGKYEIPEFHIDAKRMHLRVTYKDMSKIVGTLKNGEPDYLTLGMDAVNSEVGASSFNIVSMIWRLVCTNGLRRWENNGDAFVQRHVHLKPWEFHGRVLGAITGSLGTGMQFMNSFQDTMAQQLGNPFDVISKLAKENGFSKEFTERAKEVYEGGDRAYDIINSFTASAREMNNERKLEAERFAGKLVYLRPSQWKRLDTMPIDESEQTVADESQTEE
jgi:hypothetical protein